ncbi:anaerobic ribonucleoside-triphosphate reductase activating protein [uncultured Muribaculum sp.]|uniref:anaerobic ribonucleoside-triphosphate reductase activating protein n=1 Tax=uncultured Muribaculum sp. TaxID=1918613 RepID=UPI00267548CB|nr:anaerobic ribonucleoside-triphosphate reductase activating protein [uncultured Muribaculum sp.]
MSLRVIDIVGGTSVDGPGLRTSVYFAGCNHHCPGCHNPQSWDFEGGEAMSVLRIKEIIDDCDFNVTFSGGDPLMQPVDEMVELARLLKADGRTIWCYTGYSSEYVASRPEYEELLACIDVLVDGPFVESLRDISLRFRGSSNQRLVDVARSTPDCVVEWKG